ncbi:MAG: cupin domain-containing protein [Acidobacteriota bacterium]
MDRRQVLQVGLTALAGAVTAREVAAAPQAAAGAKAATTSRALGAHPLGASFEGWQGTMLEVTYPPGAESAAHQHPGPTFGYVVRGKIRWAINGEPAQVLEPGQSFFEPMGSVHSTSANASATEPATISVVILGKPGDPISKPAPKPGDKF